MSQYRVSWTIGSNAYNNTGEQVVDANHAVTAVKKVEELYVTVERIEDERPTSLDVHLTVRPV